MLTDQGNTRDSQRSRCCQEYDTDFLEPDHIFANAVIAAYNRALEMTTPDAAVGMQQVIDRTPTIVRPQSRYVGVYWSAHKEHMDYGGWCGRISINGRYIYKYFGPTDADEEAAATWYQEMRAAHPARSRGGRKAKAS